MRSCRDITALVSQGLDKQLSLGERLAIGEHVMMCSRCRNFKSQSQFIRKAALGYTEQRKVNVAKASVVLIRLRPLQSNKLGTTADEPI